MNNALRLCLAVFLFASAGLAQAKCVPVRICDDDGKNCHKEDMCSFYSKVPQDETKSSAAPQSHVSGQPQSLLDTKQAACDDKPVAGQPRKVCK